MCPFAACMILKLSVMFAHPLSIQFESNNNTTITCLLTNQMNISLIQDGNNVPHASRSWGKRPKVQVLYPFLAISSSTEPFLVDRLEMCTVVTTMRTLSPKRVFIPYIYKYTHSSRTYTHPPTYPHTYAHTYICNTVVQKQPNKMSTVPVTFSNDF